MQRSRAAFCFDVFGHEFVDGRVAFVLPENRRRDERGENKRNYKTQMHMQVARQHQTAKRHRYSKEFAKQATAGDLRSWRRPNLRSFMSFDAQSLNRIDVRGPPGRKQTRDQ